MLVEASLYFIKKAPSAMKSADWKEIENTETEMKLLRLMRDHIDLILGVVDPLFPSSSHEP